VAAAAERDVAIDALSWHRLTDHGAPGIVIGFGNLPEAALARAGAILEDIITHIA
jgi:hypothetical protein